MPDNIGLLVNRNWDSDIDTDAKCVSTRDVNGYPGTRVSPGKIFSRNLHQNSMPNIHQSLGNSVELLFISNPQ